MHPTMLLVNYKTIGASELQSFTNEFSKLLSLKKDDVVDSLRNF